MIGPAATEPRPDKPRPDKARAARDVKFRLIATPIVLGVIAGVFVIQALTGSAIGTHLVLAVFAALAGAEMALLFRASGRAAHPAQAAVGCGLLCAIGLLDILGGLHYDLMAARVVVLFLLVLLVLLEHLFDTRPQAVDDIAGRLVPWLYVGLGFSFLVEFAYEWRTVALVVLTAKASDMVGWAVGVPLGRHKMIPRVSPGKSWEGTVAGLLASAVAAVLLPLLLGGGYPAGHGWLERAAFGLVLGAASVLAGITWSGWKRRLGAKDSSALIPEMGGILDMVDSLLLAGPAAYAWFQVVLR